MVLWIHGGGWTTSSRTDVILNMNMEYLLAQGYAFVSCEYTLSNLIKETGKPDVVENNTQGKQMLYDLKLAIRFLRANEEKYNLDTSFICAMGESAGAHLSLLLGTTNGSKEHEAENVATMDWKDYSSDIQAMVSYSLPTDLTGDSLNVLQNSENYKDAEYYCGEVNGESVYAKAEEVVPTSVYVMAYCCLGTEYLAEHSNYTTEPDPKKWVMDDEAYAAAAFLSPFCQFNSETPPMYLIHG